MQPHTEDNSACVISVVSNTKAHCSDLINLYNEKETLLFHGTTDTSREPDAVWINRHFINK